MTITEARHRYKHGTNARYTLARCRCTACRTAATTYNRELRNDPSRQLISAEPVRAHIHLLQTQGMGIRAIAAEANITRSTLARFVDAYRPISRTRQTTADRILAVSVRVNDRMFTKSDASIVLIERLTKAGYRRCWIAEQIGLKQHLQLPVGKSPRVRVRHARRLYELYVHLSASNQRLSPINPIYAPDELLSTLPAMRGSTNTRWKSNPTVADRTQKIQHVYRHGTTGRYNIGCRCAACRAANCSYERTEQQRNRSPFMIQKVSPRRWQVLQTRDRQVVFKALGRKAASELCQQLNAGDKYYGARTMVGATEVHTHLHMLLKAGYSQASIARATGISHSQINLLCSGKLRFLRLGTADTLLATKAGVSSEYERVPAEPIWQIIDNLISIGFESGWLNLLLRGSTTIDGPRQPTMHVRRARAIMDLYAQLRRRVEIIRKLDLSPSSPRKAAA